MLSVKKPESILVAEDDLEVRNYLDLYLRCRGYSVKHAENGSEVISQLRRGGARGISLVLLDIMMPSQDGIETLREIRRVDKDLPVFMLSGSSSPTTVVEAMKCGANDFLEKPVVGEQLVDAIRRTLGSAPAPQEGSKNGWRELAAARNLGGGQSWIQKMDTLLSRVGASDAPVLLNGETGSGKEVLARM